MINDLNLYKVFYEVANYKSISKAAEILYVSQPAISKSIKLLERTIHITLFTRSSKGVRLTPEGELFYEYISRALEEISLGESLLEKIRSKEAGHINVGVSTTIGKSFFIPKLEEFAKRYPNFKINIINKPTIDTVELIKEGKIDLGIVCPNERDKTLEFISVAPLKDILVASSLYLNRANFTSTNDVFSRGSFMLLESPNVTRSHIDLYFNSLGVNIIPDIEASNMDFLIECAKSGLGITSVIRDFILEELNNGSLIELPLEKPIPERHIEIVYRDSKYLSIATKTLIDFLLTP